MHCANRDSDGHRLFRSLHKADKSVNMFVTLREVVGNELVFSRPKMCLPAEFGRASGSCGVISPADLGNEPDVSGGNVTDDDELFIREVEAVEAEYFRSAQRSHSRGESVPKIMNEEVEKDDSEVEGDDGEDEIENTTDDEEGDEEEDDDEDYDYDY